MAALRRGKMATELCQKCSRLATHVGENAESRKPACEQSGVDSHRIAVVGHSFGGQLTLLAAERDSSLRAAVTFSAAASSWENSSEVRERMLTAVRNTTVPIML